MTIESRDLIVSVNSSSYGDYKGKKANGRCITIAIRRLLKTLKNPELGSSCPVSCGSYTAAHSVVLEETNTSHFSSDKQHEKLHNRFCVRVHPFQGEKNHFCEELKKSGGEHTE